MSKQVPRAARLTRDHKCVVCEQEIPKQGFIYYSRELGGIVHQACHISASSDWPSGERERDLTRIDTENPHGERQKRLELHLEERRNRGR